MFISDGKKIIDARGAVIEQVVWDMNQFPNNQPADNQHYITTNEKIAFRFKDEAKMNRAFDLIIEAMEGAQPFVSIEGLTV